MSVAHAAKDGEVRGGMIVRHAGTTAEDLGPGLVDRAGRADQARGDREDREALVVPADHGGMVLPATSHAADPGNLGETAMARGGRGVADASPGRTTGPPLCHRPAAGRRWCSRNRRAWRI